VYASKPYESQPVKAVQVVFWKKNQECEVALYVLQFLRIMT
jgi:hypothetical protein